MANRKGLEERRVKWFQKLCQEAFYELDFSCLTELLEWMRKNADRV